MVLQVCLQYSDVEEGSPSIIVQKMVGVFSVSDHFQVLLSTEKAAFAEVLFWFTGNLKFNTHISFAEERALEIESLGDIRIYHRLRAVLMQPEGLFDIRVIPLIYMNFSDF